MNALIRGRDTVLGTDRTTYAQGSREGSKSSQPLPRSRYVSCWNIALMISSSVGGGVRRMAS